MSSFPAITVSRCDTNHLSAKPKAMNSTRGRSSSITPSMKSTSSNISIRTEVYEDLEVVKYGAIESNNRNSAKKTKNKKQALIDRVLAFFGLCRQDKMSKMSAQTEEKGPDWASPWVLPVVVLSPRKDTDRVQIKRIGICTIDTGNTQGNIVSRTFVEDVLEYPKTSIKELTEVEKEGGSGVTGHRLVPEGAIYLTWYHKKSTRVFHNMRFLISEQPMYDLIIGARSIQEHGIQDVPNLMAKANDLLTGRTAIQNPRVRDLELDKLRQTQRTLGKKKGDLEVDLAEAKAEEDEDAIKAVSEELVTQTQKCTIADKEIQLYEAKQRGNAELEKIIKRELEVLEQTRVLSPPTTDSNVRIRSSRS